MSLCTIIPLPQWTFLVSIVSLIVQLLLCFKKRKVCRSADCISCHVIFTLFVRHKMLHNHMLCCKVWWWITIICHQPKGLCSWKISQFLKRWPCGKSERNIVALKVCSGLGCLSLYYTQKTYPSIFKFSWQLQIKSESLFWSCTMKCLDVLVALQSALSPSSGWMSWLKCISSDKEEELCQVQFFLHSTSPYTWVI